MKRQDIFLGLQYIGDDLIQKAEVYAFSPPPHRHSGAKRADVPCLLPRSSP